MEVELVHTVTGDHFRLDGAWLEASAGYGQGRAVEAILLVHGAGCNFYHPLMLELAERFNQQGYGVASFDNTGHDSLWAKNPEAEACCWRGCPGCPFRQYGSSVEDVDWCRADLQACLDWLEGRGHTRTALVGHSLGAVKAIYYQARLGDPRVVAIAALSPPRLSCSYLLQSEAGEEFGANLEEAQRLMDERRPGELMKVGFPFSNLFSAANYVYKLGPREKFNVMRLAEDVYVPMLVLGGSREAAPHLRDVPADLVAAAVNSPCRESRVIEGVSHFYTGKRDEAAGVVLSWLDGLGPWSGASHGTCP